jgi:hypothetical protein
LSRCSFISFEHEEVHGGRALGGRVLDNKSLSCLPAGSYSKTKEKGF